MTAHIDYTTRLGLAYSPSVYQAAIFDWVVNGRGNAVVEAVAGSGKTTSIVSAARLISGDGLFMAFNKSIADLLGVKLAGTAMRASTVHSHGFACVRFCGNAHAKVNASKYRDMVTGAREAAEARGSICGTPLTREQEETIKDDGFPTRACEKLLDLARLALLDMDADDFGGQLLDLADRHDLADFAECLEPVVVTVVRRCMQMGADDWTEVDYTDMVWLPVINGWKPKAYAWVFVDECQDISRAALELIRRSVRAGGRILFVGDRCQPAGTLVSTPSGDVPIEGIAEGDLVVSCDVSSSAFIQKGKRVLGITARPFNGKLIVVRSGEKTTRYTPNHRCMVRFSGVRNKWCVYLQRRGNQFRVGKCAMDYAHASGPVARARAEGADALWIVGLYETEAAAWEAEATFAGRFGLPQIRFADLANSSWMNQAALDRIWLEIGSNQRQADDMLYAVGQDPRYPLFDLVSFEHCLDGVKPSAKSTASLKRPIVVRACNLIDGVEVLHYEGQGHYRASQWTACTIERESYKGFVYSMDVEKYELYVADGILTHNCQAIYGFAGADSASFQTIIDTCDAAILPLSVCYRCPTSVLEIAREWCPQIEAREGAPTGAVRDLATADFISEAREGDLVLCRRNAPLLGLCFDLIAEGIPAVVRGRDIAAGLSKIVDKVAKGHAWSKFDHELGAWESKQVASAFRRTKDRDRAAQKADQIADQAEAIRVIAARSQAPTAVALKQAIDDLFSDERGSVILSSIHKAKGLEAERVAIVEAERLPYPARQEWQQEQEANLAYVAYTRAMSELIKLKSDG